MFNKLFKNKKVEQVEKTIITPSMPEPEPEPEPITSDGLPEASFATFYEMRGYGNIENRVVDINGTISNKYIEEKLLSSSIRNIFKEFFKNKNIIIYNIFYPVKKGSYYNPYTECFLENDDFIISFKNTGNPSAETPLKIEWILIESKVHKLKIICNSYEEVSFFINIINDKYYTKNKELVKRIENFLDNYSNKGN